MLPTITGMVLAVGISMNASAIDLMPVSMGEYRITTYEVNCNSPRGRQSASGKRLEYGDAAMNGVPFGTKISIDGEVYTVVDRCGVDNTVDIFIENDSGGCHCNTLEYKEVFLIDD